MKKGLRTISIALTITLLAGSMAFAGEKQTATTVQTAAWLKPDITVELDGEKLGFKDEQGDTVYPIVNNGHTYLPLRAISGIMKEPIEWVSSAKSIFIGRTLTNPSKPLSKIQGDSPYVYTTSESAVGTPARIVTTMRYDMGIFYDFQMMDFKDDTGVTIYPIIYNGSTYLPIKALAQIMGKEITWDSETKTVYIGGKQKETAEEPDMSARTREIREAYNRSSDIYNRITAGISSLSTTRDEEKPILAASLSRYYDEAAQNASAVKDMVKASGMTEQEALAAQNLYEFAAIMEHYALLSENIAYMAAEREDYSLLADAFMNTAVATENKLDAAVASIRDLTKQD